MKKILIFGGTGAMGRPLARYLAEAGHEVYVTTRKQGVKEEGPIKYICGNAKNIEFVENLLNDSQYDAVIDFMTYSTAQFPKVIECILPKTKQYIMTSSARVYAASSEKITEDTPRLLDVCQDKAYLSTDEYALSKAKQENMLINSGRKNWTIIRPSITYNQNRLQMPIGELEEWICRAKENKSLIFPADLAEVKTTFTHGDDVARIISMLVGNEKAYGEVLQITCSQGRTWREIFEIYTNVLEKEFNYTVKKCEIPSSLEAGKILGWYYQVKYARAVNREFDSGKLESVIGKYDFISPEEGLAQCLRDYLKQSNVRERKTWCEQAYYDKVSGEVTSLSDFSDAKSRVKYVVGRYLPYFKLKNMIIDCKMQMKESVK